MSRRKQSDIRPGNIGELFLKPGEDIPYRLEACDLEPLATMIRVDSVAPGVIKPISTFSDYVLLKPVRPIEKPKPARADKGKSHQKRKPALESDGVRLCPTHKLALSHYGDMWQCPLSGCDFEIKEETNNVR